MALHVCIYEDSAYAQFHPLTRLRPVYTLRAGMVPLFQRIQRTFAGASVSLLCRHQIAPLLAETAREHPTNIIKRPSSDGDMLFINGRIRDFGDLPRLVKESRLSTVFKNNGQTVALLLNTESLDKAPSIATQAEYEKIIEEEKENIADFDTTATLYNYLWDIMADIEKEVTSDFTALRPSFPKPNDVNLHDGAYLVEKDQIYLADGVSVMPGAVIDATHGPVYIGANTRVESHASVYGPSYIGPNCVVVAGKISACSIGHTCRVGGEVEESIFHSYVNKYHAGFIGHSYIGSWVNFGAMTTNSDLKNNYSTIRCTVNGESIDTGSIKVGSFIGDHTKTGIGTLLNTGITIGICCNLFGGSLIVDKEVPSFSWGNSDKYDPYQIEKAIETVRRSMERRGVSLGEREAAQLTAICNNSESGEGVFNGV
ncbi:hypothetical protein KQH51_01925 [bacterium]|nr:hypothetical protein [bacterium]MCB2201684.1 hypothetical protein [bacterium]